MSIPNRFPPVVQAVAACVISIIASISHADEPATAPQPAAFRGALLTAGDVTEQRIEQLRTDGMTAVVLSLSGASPDVTPGERDAVAAIIGADFDLYYWIEVARCPALADAHPEWMASLQGHDEWSRLFPNAPRPAADEVVKTYPWVPVLSQETFDAQLHRVTQLLSNRTAAKGVFLNDLQGAPSACGCGHPLCRWTSDYGKRRTTVPLAPDAAALFLKAVQQEFPDSEVIPVWATECEKHDGAADGLCAGVACFDGICWKAWTEQLEPVAKVSPRVGVLTLYREFQRDLPVYGDEAGWVRHAVESFETMPRRQGAAGLAASRLVTVLQGWDVDESQVAAQIRASQDANVAGFIVAYARIDQSWQPRLMKWQR